MINSLTKILRIELIKLYIYLYIFLFPWDFFSGFFSNLTILLFIWWLLIGKKKGYFIKVKDILKNKPLIIFLLFILYATLSLLWSDDIGAGIKELGYYKYYPIIVLIFFTVLNEEDIKIIFYILIFSFGVYALFSLSIYMEFFTLNLKDGVSNKSDPKGILKYAVVNFYMAISILFSIYFFIKEKNKILKYIFIFIAIISFFTLLVNNGRMGQLSFLATVLILIVYYMKYLFKNKKILISSILIIILAGVHLYNSPKFDRYLKGVNELKTSYKSEIFSGSWGSRLFFWKAAIEIISKNAILGAGVGDARNEFIEYQKQNSKVLKHKVVKWYHNQHFELLAHFGIMGYLLFTLSIFLLLKSLYKEGKYFFYLGLVFFTILFFAGIGDSILYYKPSNYLYIIMFVLLASVLHRRESQI